MPLKGHTWSGPCTFSKLFMYSRTHGGIFNRGKWSKEGIGFGNSHGNVCRDLTLNHAAAILVSRGRRLQNKANMVLNLVCVEDI